MTNIVNTGNASVDALAEMSISGNVTPVNWYKTILREKQKNTKKKKKNKKTKKWQAIPSRYLCVVGNRVLVSSCGSTGRA